MTSTRPTTAPGTGGEATPAHGAAVDSTCAGPTRRGLLCSGTLAAAGTLALAACGGSTSSSSGTAQEEPDGGFRVPQSDTAVGSSTYYPGAGARFVITQPTAGDWHVFDASCPHEGCMTSDSDAEGNLVCPCHRSVFDPATGEPVSGPATGPLTALTVEVDGEDLLVRG